MQHLQQRPREKHLIEINPASMWGILLVTIAALIAILATTLKPDNWGVLMIVALGVLAIGWRLSWLGRNRAKEITQASLQRGELPELTGKVPAEIGNTIGTIVLGIPGTVIGAMICLWVAVFLPLPRHHDDPRHRRGTSLVASFCRRQHLGHSGSLWTFPYRSHQSMERDGLGISCVCASLGFLSKQ